MSRNKRRLLHIGNQDYELTPLGVAFLIVIAVLILAVIALLVIKHFYVPKIEADDAAVTSVSNLKPIVQTIEPTATPTPKPTPTPTPKPTPTPAPTLRTATIRSLGEFIADNDVLKAAYVQQEDEAGNDTSTFEFSSMFELIGSSVGKADYTVAEVDGSMGGKGVNGYRGKDKEYNTPPHIMLAMRESGVDLLTLASDHALDELYDGLTKTIANCVQAEMDYVGAAASQEEHDTPKIVEIKGIKVAFLNYAESFNGKEKSAAKEAMEFGVNYIRNADLNADVKNARDAGADVVVAYVSMGDQDSEKITKAQTVITKALVDAGVDVILGYNTRVLQKQPTYWVEMEREDGTTQRTLVITSLGTFLSGSTDKSHDHGMIFEFTISEKEPGVFEIIKPTYIPTYIWHAQGADGTAAYKVLAIGDWITAPPEGMSKTDYKRMTDIWSAVQSSLGSSDLNISAN